MTRKAAAALRAMQPQAWRVLARALMAEAIRRGELVRATTCQDCGSANDIHGHHEDYRFPFRVEWLCRHCHHARHAGNLQIRTEPLWWVQPNGMTESAATASLAQRVIGWQGRARLRQTRPGYLGAPRVSRAIVSYSQMESEEWLQMAEASAA